MSKYYLVEKKSGLGIFTIDFILLVVFALGFGLNIFLAFLAAIGVSVVLFLLMMIPYFGRVVVCACGCTVTICLYSIIDGLTGWLSGMRTDSPVQWWITIILAGLISIALHWVACPSPHSNGTILGDDDDIISNGGTMYTTTSNTINYNQKTYNGNQKLFDLNDEFENVSVLPNNAVPYEPASHNLKLDDIIGTFNLTQARFTDISNRIDVYGYDDLPQEFLEISQNAIRKYDVLENRMRSYVDLYNDSSVSWRNEVGADILQKAETANAAISQLESAFRLLNQTAENKGTDSEASYFRGCNTIDELNKRYRNLAKTFHPDLEVGDEETMKQVNEEYERLKVEFASNNS